MSRGKFAAKAARRREAEAELAKQRKVEKDASLLGRHVEASRRMNDAMADLVWLSQVLDMAAGHDQKLQEKRSQLGWIKKRIKQDWSVLAGVAREIGNGIIDSPGGKQEVMSEELLRVTLELQDLGMKLGWAENVKTIRKRPNP